MESSVGFVENTGVDSTNIKTSTENRWGLISSFMVKTGRIAKICFGLAVTLVTLFFVNIIFWAPILRNIWGLF